MELRMALVASHAIMWMMTGVLNASNGHPVQHENIMISLPVFVTSIIATVIFTWTVAKYDNRRVSRLDRMEQQLDRLLADLDRRSQPNGG